MHYHIDVLVEHNTLQQTLPALSHGYKRARDDLHDTQPSIWPKKRSKPSPAQSSSSSSSSSQSLTNNNNTNTNDSTSPSSKNALMLLHELKPSVEYKLVAQTGPSHRPIFTMAVEVNGQIFEGMAQTKKEAKQAGKSPIDVKLRLTLIYLAAEKALRSFSDLPFQLPDDIPKESDSTALHTENNGITNHSILSTEITDQNARTSVSPNIAEPREIQSGLGPLYLLNQLKRDAQYEEILDDNSTNSEQRDFKMAVIVDGQRFLGSGRSKKLAKTKAAQAALEKLFGMCFDKEGKYILLHST